MKRTLLVFILMLSTLLVKAQNDSISNNLKKNELKLNTTNLIAFSWLDIGYERVLNEEASIGVNLLVSFNNNEDIDLREYRTFSVTPYYRHFFSKKYAQGFFVEGFAMVNASKNDYFFDSISNQNIQDDKNYVDLALGVSGGAKFVTKRGFIAEFYFGLGRNLLGTGNLEIVGRGGISIGLKL